MREEYRTFRIDRILNIREAPDGIPGTHGARKKA
jgi:predicted DNA-binding transcriptional regulator YafY